MTWLVNGLKDSLIYVKGVGATEYIKLTDHNRSELGVNMEEISNSQRTANGTMRKNVIAQKHRFDMSWKDVPNMSQYTVDGGWAASQIYEFYKNNTQPFYIKIVQKFSTTGANTYQEFLVNFSSCSFDIVKRNPSATTPYMRMNIQITLEEV